MPDPELQPDAAWPGDGIDVEALSLGPYAEVWEEVSRTSVADVDDINVPEWFKDKYREWLDVELPLQDGLKWSVT